MHLRAAPKLTAAICILVLSSGAASQDSSASGNVQSLLREASTLIPAIEKTQQSSVASNLAGQQMRVGDLDGALDSVRRVESQQGQVFAMSNIASMLAWQGNVPLALELIRNSAAGNDKDKALGYVFVAQQLAARHAFEDARQVASLIEGGPAFFGRTNLFIDALMRIRAKQWKNADREGAEHTLDAALDAVQRELDKPSAPEFALTTPAFLYAGITSELLREGDHESALAVVERIYGLALQSSREKQSVLMALANTQARLGELQAATTTANQMEPSQQRDGVMMVIAMERTRQGDLAGAIGDAAGLSLEGFRNGSLRGIADAFAGSGDYSRALSTIDLIQTPGERAYALAELALEQARKDDPVAAQTVELASEAALRAGGETKPYVFEFIAVTRGILGDFTRAEEMISRMEDPVGAWPLWNLTEMLVHAGKESDAISLAESQIAPQRKAYALLGTATALIDKQREASRKAGDTTKQ
jgi:hypothetical protein